MGKKNPVIESTGSSRRKKRGGLDVFQFAETVEPEAWGDRAKDLQVRPLFATGPSLLSDNFALAVA